MKVKIKVGFGATIQAISYHPIETNDSLEIEVDVENDEELMKKYEGYQKIIQEKVIKNTIDGAKAFNKQRTEFLSSIKDLLDDD
jgi:hypothetical protein